MNLDLVIFQIKNLCPYFNGNVAGAADYARAVENQVWLPAPAAYVVPLEGETAENVEQGGGLNQWLTERVNVIVQFDNSADRRGQTVTSQYEPVKYMLLRALYGWRPNSSVENPGIVIPDTPGADVSAHGLLLVSHGLIDFDLARLFYRWTFELQSLITDGDGWQLLGDPLTQITAEFSIVGATPGNGPLITADLLLTPPS